MIQTYQIIYTITLSISKSLKWFKYIHILYVRICNFDTKIMTKIKWGWRENAFSIHPRVSLREIFDWIPHSTGPGCLLRLERVGPRMGWAWLSGWANTVGKERPSWRPETPVIPFNKIKRRHGKRWKWTRRTNERSRERERIHIRGRRIEQKYINQFQKVEETILNSNLH